METCLHQDNYSLQARSHWTGRCGLWLIGHTLQSRARPRELHWERPSFLAARFLFLPQPIHANSIAPIRPPNLSVRVATLY
jgi:hypothetical protein